MELTTDRLLLRRFTPADAAAFLAYRNDPDVARFQDWEGCTEEEARAFVERMSAAPCGAPGAEFQVAIALRETGELIGDCYLKVTAGDHPQAEIGYTLSRAHQGRGYATEAVKRLIDYVFDDLALHRLTAVVDSRNAPSIALLERLGLRKEGHLRQSTWFKGAWTDDCLYAVLRDEWMARRRAAERSGTQ